MTNTKIYDNMTVTVTCNEKQDDIELMNLIKKFEEEKEYRESVERVCLPKIEAIGKAKWTVIATQLLGLCKAAEEAGVRNQLYNFMHINFRRDDTGELYVLRLNWYSPLKTYQLSYGYADSIRSEVQLTPKDDYCPKSELEDKDGWLCKWDEYDIYNKFRMKLMKELQRRIDNEAAKSKEILERYDEFSGK